MNHFSQEFQQTLWWTPQPPLMEPNQSHLNSQFHRRPTNPPFYNFNLNQHQDDEDDHQQPQFPPPATNNKEPLFEKPLTPSDVGKLNRLVIPKQHAERYFPLGGGNNGGESGGEKGLLLNFEDEDGKSWRFRYSYWNSSQSYVLTKGWSRFVKDKRLDAGDVVLFERSRLDFDRLFIGWRRRNSDGGGVPSAQASSPVTANNSNGVGGWTRVFYSAPSYPSHPPPPSCNGPVCMSYPQPQPQLQPPPPCSAPPGCCLHAAAAGRGQISTPSSGNNKTLRLFGVNLECYQPDDESEPSTPDGSTISSLGGGQSQYHHYTTSQNQNHHMEMDYSGYSGDMRRSHHQS